MRPEEALELLETNPESAFHWFQLGRAFHAAGQWEPAQTAYFEALKRQTAMPEAWVNLGLLFRQRGHFSEAEESFRNALSIDDTHADAWTNLGNLLAFTGRLEEAVEAQRRAVAHGPLETDYPLNLAHVLSKAGALAEAQSLYQRVLEAHPEHVTAHWNYAHALLLQGDFQRGFAEFEWRLRRPGRAPSWAAPPWQGESLSGKTLLVQAEQGLGDSIQFIRFAAGCAARGARVVVRCPPRLRALLSGVEGVSEVVSSKEPAPPGDAQVMMMSLPAVLGVSVLPPAQAYLFADEGRVRAWAPRVGTSGFRIGICWQGSRDFEADHLRSFGLQGLSALARMPGVRLISLQKGEGENERADVDFPVETLEGLDEGPDGFLDTAAVMASLDLVVTSDTSVAHLAGALGKDVFVVLPFSPDWRWQLHTPHSPWYPKMRLFRQEKTGDWAKPFEQVGQAVEALLKR